VNANTATPAELQAAFAAAGLANPAQWAREVNEYRPYPTDDPTFAKLRGELVKYNPDQATIDGIIATLRFSAMSAPTSVSVDQFSSVLRRGLVWLAVLTTVGIAVELAVERHWTQPVQLIAWGAVAIMVVALAMLLPAPTGVRVRTARILAAVVVLTSAVGIWEHVAANYDAGPLDFHYTGVWDNLPEVSRWWLAVTKTVGPSPPLAPGALAQAGLSVLLATIGHPALRGRTESFPAVGQAEGDTRKPQQQPAPAGVRQGRATHDVV